MAGRRATLNDTTLRSIEGALYTSFVYLFIFIAGNAVSVMNLNYKLLYDKFCMKNC